MNHHHWGGPPGDHGHRRDGRGDRWARGGRPPWWPADEPFPPADWPHARRRFPRRWLLFAVVALAIFTIVIASLATVLLQAVSAITGRAPHPIFMVVAMILVLLALTGGARGASRLAAPVGDLIEAAERIERGDYATRVTPRGPRTVRSLGGAFNAMSARLERSETERRRLLADVTHELRTPLTVIQGDVEAMIDGVHAADREHLEALLDETHVLARLIDDLRTVSLAEAGALALHREPTDVSQLVRETLASFDAAAAAAGVRLTGEAEGAGSAAVDPLRVREVLTNVIANALRYTPRGGEIAVRATGDEARVAVGVKDSGPGIAPDVLPHVFDRFTRSPESPGAGLGLAIAKSLVTAHGGTIEATSTPGQGTEIRFTLPRVATEA